MDYELLGLVGEVQGEHDFGVTRDPRLLVGGDGRIDFKLKTGETGDWKIARKAYNLLLEQRPAESRRLKPDADILIVGLWHETQDRCWVEWLGWSMREELLQVEPIDFGKGVINHYRAVHQLKPMSQFIHKLRS